MEITLKADGFTFTIEPASPLHGWFDGKIELTSALATHFALQDNFYTPFEDWSSLCDYIEKHIDKTVQEGDIESPTWVCYDASLQFTCLEGEIEYQNGLFDGGFTLRVMLKIGSNPGLDEEGKYANVGFESWVDVNEALGFCHKLQEYVNSQTKVVTGVGH